MDCRSDATVGNLVERGYAPDEADKTVKRASMTLDVSSVTLAALLVARYRRSAQRHQ
jgi:cytochrome oxidase assembly protein ShyY1